VAQQNSSTPSRVNSTPSRVHSKPVQVHSTPSGVHSTPSRVHSTPMAHSKPVQVRQNSVRVQSTPGSMALPLPSEQLSPSKAQPSPSKALSTPVSMALSLSSAQLSLSKALSSPSKALTPSSRALSSPSLAILAKLQAENKLLTAQATVDKSRIKQLECDLDAALKDCVLLTTEEQHTQDKLIHVEEVVARGMEVFSNGVSEALKQGAFKGIPFDFRGPPVSSPAIEAQRSLATTDVATKASTKASPNQGGEVATLLSHVQLQPVSITISQPASSFEPKRWVSKFGRQTFSKALNDATMIKSRASPDKLSFYNYHKNVVADKNEDMEWFKMNNPKCLNWFVDGFETDFNYSQREQFFHYIAPALVADCQKANGWQEVWMPLDDKYRFAVVADDV